MNNTVTISRGTNRNISRTASNKANVPPSKCQIFKVDRSQYLSQTAPYVDFRDVDIRVDVIMANPPYPRLLKNSPSERLEKSFRSYADKWYAEISGDSSLTRITGNVNYLKIIKLGDQVVPLILRELQKQPAPWFLALRILTEETNVGREYAGNFNKIAEAWIAWGKARGLI